MYYICSSCDFYMPCPFWVPHGDSRRGNYVILISAFYSTFVLVCKCCLGSHPDTFILLHEPENRFYMLGVILNEWTVILHYKASTNRSIISALNGGFKIGAARRWKSLHQLLPTGVSAQKLPSWKKGFTETPYQSLGSVSLECFAAKMSTRAQTQSRLRAMFTLSLHGKMGRTSTQRYCRSLSVACDWCTAAVPPFLIPPLIYLFTGLCVSVSSF